jgi:ABC-type ATPase with predicted acetyltransferase domain
MSPGKRTMALFACENCGTELSGNANACPACGARRKTLSAAIWGAARFIVALLIALLAYRCTLPDV